MLTRRGLLYFPALASAAAPRVEVIAHRGEHIECPENTIPAIEKAIALGADWVEIDVRTTKDGHFVLMHDSGPERTTGVNGQIAEMTLAEVQNLDASNQKPGFAKTRVPTLDQALSAMRGKCGVYFDAKRIPADAIIAGLERNGMVDRCVVYGGLALAKELTTAGYGHLAMPEAVSPAVARRIVTELNVKTIAFDRRDFTPEIIAVAKAARKGVFVDRLGNDDNEPSWLEALKWGATGIQTDHPGELVKLLRQSG